jgi:hypothetical protein
MANYAGLSVPGALALDGHLSVVPNTIRDAMNLVRMLRERYIWVDSLCIIQDDPVIKHRQISQMDMIYSHALLTIIGIEGVDANAHLRGLPPHLRLSGHRQIIDSFGYSDYLLVSNPPTLETLLQDSHYETRGWTFQERLLSRRCAILSRWGMFFQCREAQHSEMGKVARYDSRDSRFSYSLLESKEEAWSEGWGPAFLRYARLAEIYTRKNLRYSSDRLNAFAGICSYLSSASSQNFRFGHPEKSLLLSLLWVIPPDRSVGEDHDSLPLHRNSLFPSWSWMGWDNQISYIFTERNLKSGFEDDLRQDVEFLDLNSNGSTQLNPNQHVLHLLAFTISARGFSNTTGFSSGPTSWLTVQRADTPRDGKARRFLLRDKEGRLVGFLFDRGLPEFQDGQNLCDFMLLFSLGAGLPHPDQEDDSEFRKLRFLIPENFEGSRTQVPMSVFMMIQWKGDYAERLGIGVMTGRAWARGHPTKKLIRLG